MSRKQVRRFQRVMTFGLSGMRWLADWELSEGISINCMGRAVVITHSNTEVDYTKSFDCVYPMDSKEAILEAESALEEALEEHASMTCGSVVPRQSVMWYWPPQHRTVTYEPNYDSGRW